MSKSIIHFLLCALLLGQLTACGGLFMDEKGRWGLLTPRPHQLSNIPDGDDSFSQGFRDGCNTAVGIIGTGLLRSHASTYDVDRALEDDEYYKGYREGSTYCTYYMDTDPL